MMLVLALSVDVWIGFDLGFLTGMIWHRTGMFGGGCAKK